MNQPSKIHFTDANRRVAADHLKLCPLCNAVNARQNVECFVCRWSGGFEHDPELIEIGVHDLLEQCPELLNTPVFEAIHKPSLLAKLREFWHRNVARRSRIDLLT